MHICFPGWEIPWRREWQPTLVFLPGESHGQKSLGAPVHKVTKSRTRLKQLSMHTYLLSQFLFRSEGYFFERGGSLHGFETCLFSGLVEVVVKISHELSRNIGNRNSGILRTFESLPLLIVYWKEKQENELLNAMSLGIVPRAVSTSTISSIVLQPLLQVIGV